MSDLYRTCEVVRDYCGCGSGYIEEVFDGGYVQVHCYNGPDWFGRKSELRSIGAKLPPARIAEIERDKASAREWEDICRKRQEMRESAAREHRMRMM